MAEVTGSESLPQNKSSSNLLSKHSHRRFRNVAAYVKELGGDKGRVIEKVLIANNGNAAVKAIRSIRRWAYEVFGDERAIQFVVMATPEDLRANAEYIRMGDVIVDVPGGANNHNYANVTLIVELARLHGVHAVWAGWGHASENPLLPDTLNNSNPPIKFVGPAGPAMRALGDKIGSTIIAQSAGVPCIAWNGQDVEAEYNKETGSLSDGAFDKACIHTATEAQQAAEKIGFPIMIKASEGGGGKGIRRVNNAKDVANSYRQVCGEVPGSPIFIMKLSSNSRHLEVQLIGDEYGNAIALNGRDCSVQRRHQKIIEEGPPIAADPKVWFEMEKAAVALGKAVDYTNCGTVEYLYSEREAKFFFLELNPRLQVEHPVTEMITKANLPAAQLQVAMGIPLYNIPDIRELYGRNRFEDNPKAPGNEIDFETTERVRPYGHCIAVRITAENAEQGFKPTSGGIHELNFRSTPNVWGYFSMDSSGSIHEFADSQFGHLFASGPDREQARRNMVLALKELSIRGDISTTVDYISKLIELDDFVNNNIDTAWLDGIIQQNVEGMGAAEGMLQRRTSDVKINTLHDHVYVVLGGAIVAKSRCDDNEKSFLDLLDKGQLPQRSLLKMRHGIELILNGVKYQLSCIRNGQNSFAISIKGNEANRVVTGVRLLSDGGYLIDVCGNSHVAYLTRRGDAGNGMRLNIGGASIVFSPDYDPTALRTDVAGKLVKKLVVQGSKVKKGEAYCEVEVMKMFMPLKVEESGCISWHTNEGATLGAGDLLASLELDNPENVETVTVFDGDLNVPGWGMTAFARLGKRPHLMLRAALSKLQGAMAGYLLLQKEVDRALEDLATASTDSTLPVFETQEELSVLSGRIPPQLYESISNAVTEFKRTCERQAGTEVRHTFPAKEILMMIDNTVNSIQNQDEKAAFEALTAALRNAVVPYERSKAAGVPGAERVLLSFMDILRRWISVERWFYDGRSYADAVDGLRRTHKNESIEVMEVCRAHEQLKTTAQVIVRLVTAIGDGTKVDIETSAGSSIGKRVSLVAGAASLPNAMPAIQEIGSMGGSDPYAEVALRARKVLMQESMPNLEQRKQKVVKAAKSLATSPDNGQSREVEELLADHIPMSDVFFPLLSCLEDSKEQLGLMELYIRHLYRPYTLKSFESFDEENVVKFTFSNKPAESAVNAHTSLSSMTDLNRIVSSGSLSKLSEHSEDSVSESSLLVSHNKEKIPQTTLRTGLCALLDRLHDLKDSSRVGRILKQFTQLNGDTCKSDNVPVNVLYCVVRGVKVASDENPPNELASECESIMKTYDQLLMAAGVRRVSIIFDEAKTDQFQDIVPVSFTFGYPDYREDPLVRRIDPSHAMHLDLDRVAANFRITSLGSRHTSTCHVHLYEGKPRTGALAKVTQASKEPRIFSRALSFVLDFSSASFERILVDALNAMDLCAKKSKSDNHLFLNLVSDVEKAVLDPVVVEQVIVAILKRHDDRLSGLGIAEVETKIVCRLTKDSAAIAIRLFASNPTGYVQVMNTYVEAATEHGGQRVFKLIGGTKASLASAGDSSWDGKNVSTPYPLIRPFDVQRKAALHASDSLYCYDIPALLEAAVEQEWLKPKGRHVSTESQTAARPLMVMYTKELVVKNCQGSGAWTMADYMSGSLELEQVDRGAGANDVGMIAWLIALKTEEYPNGRQIVLIANDITFKAGSFGTREDVVFKLASEYARKHRIPRLFIAANSGARIGLADHVKKVFKVAFKSLEKPETGFDFLYVDEEDYTSLTEGDKREILVERAQYGGRQVHRITDIIGAEPDLGVENLKGSGLIAGETSVAYEDIFTMTVVLGRSVGIGAYLVRLGQRTIQKQSASPIILTGYQALNKLMGVDVYSTNDQLGGPGIMYPNGISHVVESDHLAALKAAVKWLSYVPSVRGGILPVTDIRGFDTIDRKVDFIPQKGVPYDPRHLLAGRENDSGEFESGFFDCGSFTEYLAGWAKTVVIGRARLGGIPMGVIITENRTTEAIKPADPADVRASESVVQEAGCVWFPNSAYKTAQAIRDFRTEDLPLIVFANWRGFSGGQRDMFDEVLKYGSLIVDAFVSYQQPIFVFIPPFAEIRGGAWVVLDASINAAVMEMYAARGTSRGGVLEANGLASVKYRTKDLIATMHRLDEKLLGLDDKIGELAGDEGAQKAIRDEIKERESLLLPVYAQISVHFCELHDTPGRMEAVGVIERQVDWEYARNFFYWRLRRKLAEFDIRKRIIEAAQVGRGIAAPTAQQASDLIKKWFLESANATEELWSDDKAVLQWMSESHDLLQQKIVTFTRETVAQEVLQVMTAGGTTAQIGTAGILSGIRRALESMPPDQRQQVANLFRDVINF